MSAKFKNKRINGNTHTHTHTHTMGTEWCPNFCFLTKLVITGNVHILSSYCNIGQPQVITGKPYKYIELVFTWVEQICPPVKAREFYDRAEIRFACPSLSSHIPGNQPGLAHHQGSHHSMYSDCVYHLSSSMH